MDKNSFEFRGGKGIEKITGEGKEIIDPIKEVKRFSSYSDLWRLKVGQKVVFLGRRQDDPYEEIEGAFQNHNMRIGELYEIVELPEKGKDHDQSRTYFGILDGNGERVVFGYGYFGTATGGNYEKIKERIRQAFGKKGKDTEGERKPAAETKKEKSIKEKLIPLTSFSRKEQEYLEILGLGDLKVISKKQIKEAFRRLSQKWHPDHLPSQEKALGAATFRLITEAKDSLMKKFEK